MNLVFCSILLPIYRGERYISELLKSCLVQTDPDFEIVVSIDSDDDKSFDIAKGFSDPRLQVFQSQNRLGMLGNYKFLIEKATGEWITIVGQDDGVMPFALQQLRRISNEFPNEKIVSSRRAYAFWPGKDEESSSYRFIYPFDARNCRIENSSKFLMMSMIGHREYLEGPQLYTGSFVKRKLIEEIEARQGGEFYKYPIPDVASAASLLMGTKSYVYCPLPLFWIGTSESSTGKAIDKVQHETSIESSTEFLSKSFLGESSLELSTIPGRGLFTSFSWYVFEAFCKIQESSGIKYEPAPELTNVLAALIVENSEPWNIGRANYPNLIGDLTSLSENFSLKLRFKIFKLQCYLKVRQLNRLIFAARLLLVGRLYVEKQNQKLDLTYTEISNKIYHKYTNLFRNESLAPKYFIQ